jgi:hypothetical protein
MSKLRNAVENWIRAEHAFRLGPDAYSNRTQAWLIQAEEQLRKACSGKKHLHNAAKALGVKVEQERPRERVRLITPATDDPSYVGRPFRKGIPYRPKGGLFG